MDAQPLNITWVEELEINAALVLLDKLRNVGFQNLIIKVKIQLEQTKPLVASHKVIVQNGVPLVIPYLLILLFLQFVGRNKVFVVGVDPPPR